MNFWKRYPADYQRKTARLTLAQHGAYTLLLDEVYLSETPLPADVGELYRICRAMSKPEQEAVRVVADQFFPINGDGKRHNKRAGEELEDAAPKILAARANGSKGGRKKHPNVIPIGSKTGTQQEPSGFTSGIANENPLGKLSQNSELRKEEKDPPTPRGGSVRFANFWAAWPRSKRKGAEDKCREIWSRKRLDDEADSILAHVAAMACDEDWLKQAGQFIPAPRVYLTGAPWRGADLSAIGSDTYRGKTL